MFYNIVTVLNVELCENNLSLHVFSIIFYDIEMKINVGTRYNLLISTIRDIKGSYGLSLCHLVDFFFNSIFIDS